MMECLDPITKLTWDNAILISPRLAKELEERDGVQIFPSKKPMNKDSAFFESAKGTLQNNKAVFNRGKEMAVVAQLTINGRSIEAPIHVVPGMANYTIELPLGLVAPPLAVLVRAPVSMLMQFATPRACSAHWVQHSR